MEAEHGRCRTGVPCSGGGKRMSVEALAAAIWRALDLLARVRADAEHVAGLLGEARDAYAAVLYGANDPEAKQLPVSASQAAEAATAVHGPLRTVDESLRAYLHELGATGRDPTTPPRRPDPTPAPAPTAPGVPAPDGSRYPTEAAWCVDMLPCRVRAGQPSTAPWASPTAVSCH